MNLFSKNFQAELAKRILRLPKFSSNRVASLALKWPSVRARVLCIKLGFLLKLLTSDDSLSSRVFRSLSVSGIESLLLVHQCWLLESVYESNLTHYFIPFKHLNTINETSGHRSRLCPLAQPSCFLHHVYAVAASSESSWPKVWDVALDSLSSGRMHT